MKQLWLLRHAEAEPASAGLTDFERPLTAAGRAQAAAAAAQLRQLDVRPDLMLASPALRASETALIVAQRLQCPAVVRYQPSLYQASAAQLLAALQGCEAGVSTLLLVAHNPGLSQLAQRLGGPSAKLGTGALCRIELP